MKHSHEKTMNTLLLDLLLCIFHIIFKGFIVSSKAKHMTQLTASNDSEILNETIISWISSQINKPSAGNGSEQGYHK